MSLTNLRSTSTANPPPACQPDDRNLAGCGGVAAEAVDLPRRPAHQCGQHRVEFVAIGLEVFAQQVDAFGCSAAKLHGAQWIKLFLLRTFGGPSSRKLRVRGRKAPLVHTTAT